MTSRKIFANRLWSGAFTRSIAPTSFYPLLCGAATPEQTRHLLAHLENPADLRRHPRAALGLRGTIPH